MNAFERFGIEHLSPSSCNLFVASPAAFVLQKVLKKVTSVGAAAHRGTAAESGVVHGLQNPTASLADCVKVATDQFALLTAMSGDPRLEKERDSVPGFVEQGLRELKPYGQPIALQGKIEHRFEGLVVPFTGYFDMKFSNGIIVDLKTTHSQPSQISVPHARQVSLYMAAEGCTDGRVSYVTSKKSITYKVENYEQHLEALAKIGHSIQRFLSISSDPLELAGLVMPDVDSFYFNDPITRKAVFDVWGV